MPFFSIFYIFFPFSTFKTQSSRLLFEIFLLLRVIIVLFYISFLFPFFLSLLLLVVCSFYFHRVSVLFCKRCLHLCYHGYQRINGVTITTINLRRDFFTSVPMLPYIVHPISELYI